MQECEKLPLLVSACLLGSACRYDGGEKRDARVLALSGRYTVIPMCPEQLGGLPTPRPPSERRGERVCAADGTDVTGAFLRGAEETLRIAKQHGCSIALLKARSPSCGSKHIYDGTFSGRVIPGDGVTVALLKAHGIAVYSEEDFPF